MLLLIFLSLFVNPTPAQARNYDLYRSDRRFKGGFCSAIGGACAADDDLVTGIFENPASLATGRADWDFDGDYSTHIAPEGDSADATDRSIQSGILGAGYSTGDFGFGAGVSADVDKADAVSSVIDADGNVQRLRAQERTSSFQVHVPFGVAVTTALSLGAALTVSHTRQLIAEADNDGPADNAVSGYSLGVSLGALYTYSPRLRFGTWYRFPTHLYDTLHLTTSPPATVVNYKEDFAFHNPWLWALGAQIGLGEENRLYLELDVIGSTRDAFLYSFTTFSAAPNETRLRRKGRDIVLEPHVGFRTPLGRGFRLHTGSYYENTRVDDAANRLHGTVGISAAVFDKLEIIGGVDVSRNYQQLIFTFR